MAGCRCGFGVVITNTQSFTRVVMAPSDSYRRVAQSAGDFSNLNLDTILYAPGMQAAAQELVDSGEGYGACNFLCTEAVVPKDLAAQGFGSKGVCAWNTFSSDDPDVKLRIDALVDKHVVFFMNCERNDSLFTQLNVLMWLQRFVVPHPVEAHAKTKWKTTVATGAYDVCSIASLTLIVPWVRHCQMERTCRWTLDAVDATGKWGNSKADGEFVDVPTLGTFMSMLSATPCDGAKIIPRRVLFIDLHEYADVESWLNGSAAWSNTQHRYLDFAHLSTLEGGGGLKGMRGCGGADGAAGHVIEVHELSKEQ